jgi:uncharacterized protein YcfL
MKILTILLVIASCLLVGCGSKDEAETPKGPDPIIKDPNAVKGGQAQAPDSKP